MIARIAAALLVSSTTALAQVPTFHASAVSVPIFSPMWCAVGHVDGDATVDIVTGGTDLPIALVVGDGIGGLMYSSMLIPNNFYPQCGALADLNGDGRDDLAVGFGDSVSIWLSTGSAGWAAEVPYFMGLVDPQSLHLIDLNGDGFRDLVTVNTEASRAVAVRLNNGFGVFGTVLPTPIAGGCRFGVVADINNDTIPDAVVVHQVPSPLVSVLLGNGNGTFGSPMSVTTNSISFACAVGDVNSDGKLDVLTDHGAVLLGDGTGVLSLNSVLPCGPTGYGCALADLDTDGKLDAVIRNEGTNGNIVACLGDGSGGFAAAVTVATLPGRGLVIADVDGEGSPDLVACDVTSTNIWMFINNFHLTSLTTGYCFGDGTSALCPCGTSAAGNGCPNSITASGAHLASTGYAGVTYDTFKLTSTGVPNGPGLYFQGTGTTDLPYFGDGKFCAGIGVIRLGVTFASGNASSYPDATLTTPIHTAGGIGPGGGTRFYQAWYRDTDPTFCTPSLFNLTNGLSVAWVP